MKKLLVFLAITGSITACNNAAQKDAVVDSTSTSTTPSDTTTATAPAAVKDSLMQFKDGKVVIFTAGAWAPLAAPLTATNGRVINPNGEVSKGGKTRKLEEGMQIDKDGQLMDKDGKMVDNTGWE